MSYASKQSGFTKSNEVAFNVYPTNAGNTFPNGDLVSGTEYIIAVQSVPPGTYGVMVTFDLQGDATTNITSIYLRVSLGDVVGTQSDYNICINTTLPDDSVYSFTYNSFVFIGSEAFSVSPIYATMLPIFTGLAPISPSYYIRLYKLV